MDIRKEANKGIRWSIFGSVSLTGVQFLQNLVLAWILLPDDFGNMALAFLFVGIAIPFFENGLNQAIIQDNNADENQLSSLFWISSFAGVLTFLAIWALAPLNHYFFDSPDLTTYIRTLAPVFFIIPIGGFYSSILLKELRFDIHNSISVVQSIIGLLVAIILAWMGYGIFALIYGFIANKLVFTLLAILYGKTYFLPKGRFNLSQIKGLLSFGIFHSGSSIVNFINSNIDKALIGSFLGANMLGYYYIAWNLILLPLTKINPIVNKVAFPIYSKIKNENKRLEKYYTTSVMMLLILNLPIFLIIGLHSEGLLNLVYGEKWIPSAASLSILCLVGYLKSFANPGGSLLLAKGRADINLYWNIFWTVILYLILFACLSYNPSIEWAAWGQLIAAVLIGPLWHFLISKFGQISYRKITLEFTSLALVGFIICFVAWTCQFYLSSVDIESMWKIIISIVLVGLLYLTIVIRGFGNYIKEISKTIL